ncbi:MAG: metallophosphoesterase family protein [Christensenellales bacterium]|jgi:predicted phosphodiesterase
MENRKLRFRDGKLKIMQLTDTQELPVFSPDTIRLIEHALRKEKPDLVVFTGDQLKGYSGKYRGKHAERRVSQAIHTLIAPLVKHNTPFLVTFGNHDRQVGLSNAEQMEIYSGYSLCCNRHAEHYEPGTLCMPVYDERAQRIQFALYLFDSQGNARTGGYETVRQDQITWYREKRDELAGRNGGVPVYALVFQHIPLPEYYCVLQRIPRKHAGAIRAYRTHKNKHFRLPPPARADNEFFKEPPSVPDENAGEFDAFLQKQDILGVYCGHDHSNSFVRNYKGIDLGYTQSSGFNEYGPGILRGVRLFTLCQSDTSCYRTYTQTFGELCGERVSRPFLDLIYRIMPTSKDQLFYMAFRAGAALLLGAAGLGALLLLA